MSRATFVWRTLLRVEETGEDVLTQSTRAIDFDPGTDAVAYVKVCVDIACTARAENGILFRVKAR